MAEAHNQSAKSWQFSQIGEWTATYVFLLVALAVFAIYAAINFDSYSFNPVTTESIFG